MEFILWDFGTEPSSGWIFTGREIFFHNTVPFAISIWISIFMSEELYGKVMSALQRTKSTEAA